MRLRAFALAAVLLAVAACNGKAKRELATFQAAQAKAGEAMDALKAAKLQAAHDRYEEAVSGMTALRRTRVMDETLGDGPVFFGLTAKAWQAQWERDFKAAIEARLPDLQARAAAGTLDWLDTRAFLTTYRPDLDAQWLEALNGAVQGQLKRLGDVYVFECESPGAAEVCGAIRAALPGKLLSPLTDEKLLTGEARAQAFGFVRVDARFARERKYANLKDPVRNVDYALPSLLQVVLTVESHRGATSWDGETQITFEAEPPVNVATDSLRSTETAHFRALTDGVLAQLAAKPRQTRP